MFRYERLTTLNYINTALTLIIIFTITHVFAQETYIQTNKFTHSTWKQIYVDRIFKRHIKNNSSSIYAGSLTFKTCDYENEILGVAYNAKCANIKVPENRLSYSGKDLTLPVTILESIKTTKPDHRSPYKKGLPIFWFDGGPGSPNKFTYPTDDLLDDHDIVIVGYRGIDDGNNLECDEIATATEKNIPALFDFKNIAESKSAASAIGESALQCATRIKSEGVDLDAYTINQIVEDYEAVRTAMALPKINIYGDSFGTRLELLYLSKYPQNVQNAALVAVNPPGGFTWDPKVTDSILKQYSIYCSKDPDCSLRVEKIAQQKNLNGVEKNLLLYTIIKNLSLNLPAEANKESVELISFFSLFESLTLGYEQIEIPVDETRIFKAPSLNAPSIIDMWLDAAEGDFSGMIFISQFGHQLGARLASRGHFYTMGASSPDYYQTSKDYYKDYTESNTVLGSPFALLNWSVVQGWPKSPDISTLSIIRSDVNTLFISGELDASTPFVYTKNNLLPYFKNGKQIIIKGLGHTESFWSSQAEARKATLNEFFLTGKKVNFFRDQKPVFKVTKEFDWSEAAKKYIDMLELKK